MQMSLSIPQVVATVSIHACLVYCLLAEYSIKEWGIPATALGIPHPYSVLNSERKLLDLGHYFPILILWERLHGLGVNVTAACCTKG